MLGSSLQGTWFVEESRQNIINNPAFIGDSDRVFNFNFVLSLPVIISNEKYIQSQIDSLLFIREV